MINQSDPYLVAFLARDRIFDLTSERRRSEPIFRNPGRSWRLRDLFRSPTPSEGARDRYLSIGG